MIKETRWIYPSAGDGDGTRPWERDALGETMVESLSVAPMNFLLSPYKPQALVNNTAGQI